MTEVQKECAEEIVNKIKQELSNDENLCKIWYHEDEYGGGILLNLSLKQAPQYKYIGMPIPEKDLSHIDQVVDIFVSSWKNNTTQEDINSFIRFIKAGEKYGWD